RPTFSLKGRREEERKRFQKKPPSPLEGEGLGMRGALSRRENVASAPYRRHGLADRVFEHFRGQPAGIGVVARAVEAIDQGAAVAQPVFGAVGEGERGAA